MQFRYFLCIASLAFATCISDINAQVLHDSSVVSEIKVGINNMYNLEFDKAEHIFSSIEQTCPGHPVNHLLKGIMLYWKYCPLIAASPERPLFEEELYQCIELSLKKPYSDEYLAESLLLNMCARGLLLVFYSDNDLTYNTISLAAESYKYLRRSFDYVSYFPDFYFFTGVYNYYWEAVPEAHPVYKPFAALFPPGNRQEGLKQLAIAADRSIFLPAEAYAILTWIYTGYENNSQQALYYSRTLNSICPGNSLFKAHLIKNLLIVKDYDQAESVLKTFGLTNDKSYFNALSLIFNGILQEKKYQNYSMAEQFYEDGINAVSAFGSYGEEYAAYAWFGMSRIQRHNGDKIRERAYRRKAEDMIYFKKVNFD